MSNEDEHVEREFDRGYRLGNRDGIEFALEQVIGRIKAARITRRSGRIGTEETLRIIEEVRNA